MLFQYTSPVRQIGVLLCISAIIIAFATQIAHAVPATPPAIYTEPTPAANPYSDSVGATPGAVKTDETGGFNYSVSLYTPPGTAGVAPQLSLDYHSRGGNGPMGPGWSLGGLSAITHCRKGTEFGDGAGPFAPITFADTTHDALCLDGQRLFDLGSAGQCPGTARAFGLEMDTSTRVCGYTQGGIIGYASFLVFPKDGSVRRYGAAGNSALFRNDSYGTPLTDAILTFGLDRSADSAGNTIDYAYTRDSANGELNLATVSYTGKVDLGGLPNFGGFTRAPFATVNFAYTTMPLSGQRIDYTSGMKLALTQRLSTITVTGPLNNTLSPDTPTVVRTYHLNYTTGSTGSQLSQLTSLQECAPGGSGEVCYPSTVFNWQPGGQTNAFQNPPLSAGNYSSSLSYAVDFKTGDTTGAGHQGLVWIKDQSCDSSGSGVNRLRFMISAGNGTGLNAPIATPVYANVSRTNIPGSCGGSFTSAHLENTWFLYDFTGDGRDDLLVLTTSGWRMYSAISNGAGGWTFSAASIDLSIPGLANDDGKLADFNGDGLPDLIHTNSGVLGVRFLHRAGSAGPMAFVFDASDTPVDIELNGTESEVGLFSGSNTAPSADVNGDGAADLVLQVLDEPVSCGPPGGPSGGSPPSSQPYRARSSTEPDPTVACPLYWYVYINSGIQPGGHLLLSQSTRIGQVNVPATGITSVQLVDLNQDGLADVLYQQTGGAGKNFYTRLNTGNDNVSAPRFTSAQSTGLSLPTALAAGVQLLDVNGDHRLDLLYAIDLGSGSARYPLKTRLWTATGYGPEIAAVTGVATNTVAAQNPAQYLTLLLDINGDGAADLIRFHADGSSTNNLYVAPSELSFGGNDAITRITNGLGAITQIEYSPLVYSSTYVRAFDGPAQHWGRDSPVFDVFASLWVVRQMQSSAPTEADANALSTVKYTYAGARLQSGGRGFLGFQSVQTEDVQTNIITTTDYRQDFPFIGRPTHTVVTKVSAPLGDPCASDPNAPGCFVDPPPNCGPYPCPIAPAIPPASTSSTLLPVVGQVLSDSADTWQSLPAFVPGAQQSLFTYLSLSDEQKFDLDNPGTFSHEVVSSFTFDVYGNPLSSIVRSYAGPGAPVLDDTTTTTNVYGCTTSPPTTSGCVGGALNIEWQRLARLSISTVTSARSGETTVTRRSSFEYDPTTKQLIAEIQGPYDDEGSANVRKRYGLRTDYLLDANGNRIQAIQCSTFHFANRSACTNLSGFRQRQWADDPSTPDATKIQRYTTFTYDPKGRFRFSTAVPFYAAGGGTQLGTSYEGVVWDGSGLISWRNAFGDSLFNLDPNGILTTKTYGALGRAQFSSITTGAFGTTTYTWCQDVINADIPIAAPRVNCPVGAIYRVTSDSTATASPQTGNSVAPTSFAYFDRLGREVLKTTRIYQQDGASLNRWSSVASYYDNLGRTARATVPYFSVNPTQAQSGGRAGTAIGAPPAFAQPDYDELGRTKALHNPEQASNGPSETDLAFNALQSDITNPRRYTSHQVKNARDETVAVTDPNGFGVNYRHAAFGNLRSVTRTPADGSNAGITITTSMTFDRLGRKLSMSDPDKGSWSYDYNALGELIAQTDAKGQTQTLYRDALGRVFKRTETRITSGSTTSEPISTWEFDTAIRGSGLPVLGALHIESNGLGGFQRQTEYETYARVSTVTTTLDGNVYTQRATYDAFSRVFQRFDASPDPSSPNGNLAEYSTDGYPIRTRESANGTTDTLYNEVIALDARGHVYQERLANNSNLTTTRTYDNNTGRLLNITTGFGGTSLQNWTYTYDVHSNLTSRWNRATGFDLQEQFNYDDLDRLTTVTLQRFNGSPVNTVTLNTSFDQLGNITSKSGLAYSYASRPTGCSQNAGPHAVSQTSNANYCYDANGNQTTATYTGGATRTIVYTGYDLPETITTTGNPSNATVGFKYAPDRAMWKRTDGGTITSGPGCAAAGDRVFCNSFENGGIVTSGANTTYYVGNVEILTSGTTLTTKRYIGGYLVITTTQVGGGTPSAPSYAYLLRDGLGSIDLITDQNANVLQRESFDAHGQRRYAAPAGSGFLWNLLPSAQAASFDTSTTHQGYTGHEQLDGVGLVHMKGRLYDPVLGRFIQADPMTEPDATQGLNRYTYVQNNPLSLTDPTGYFSFRQLLGVAIGVVAAVLSGGAATPWLSFLYAVGGGFTSAYVATGSLKAGLWGAFAAGIFWGIGTAFKPLNTGPGTGVGGSGFSGGAYTAKVAAHASAGGVLTKLQGGKFGHGFVSAGVTEALSPSIDHIGNTVGRIAASAAVGGTVSAATGGKFSNGAITGAFQAAFSRAVEAATYRSTGPDIGISTDPTPDSAGPKRLQTFYEAMAASDEAGIVFGTGTRSIYVDSYAYLVDGSLRLCSSSCDAILEQYGMITGAFDSAANRITLYRGAVEPQWISGQDYANGGATTWAEQLTRTGVESAIWTLGHEAAHSLGIDVNLPSAAFHSNAERAGQAALMRYRASKGGG